MNILLIGNGFDLAHELPTTYKDFLDFVKTVVNTSLDRLLTIKYIKNDPNNYSKNLKRCIEEYMNSKNYIGGNCTEAVIRDGFKELIEGNIWFEYFESVQNQNGGWIDFELEISKVVQGLDSIKPKLKSSINTNKPLAPLLTDEEKPLIKLARRSRPFDLNEYEFLKNKLEKDLNRLIDCLEAYLIFFINTMNDASTHLSLNIDHVLSFNYTNTYQRLYDEKNELKYDYIHGKAREFNRNADNTYAPASDIFKNNSNIVIGIDEYLDDSRKNKDLEFIHYKKYFQRIYKRTGCKYKNWLEHINKENEKSYLYILGHSLDVTDKDILNELIRNDYIKTTIYYHSPEAYDKQIINLVKVLGQDDLITMVYGTNPKIKFIDQDELKSTENKELKDSEKITV